VAKPGKPKPDMRPRPMARRIVQKFLDRAGLNWTRPARVLRDNVERQIRIGRRWEESAKRWATAAKAKGGAP
jgi:hypothetical protein